MNRTMSSPVLQVIAATLQQRRNEAGLWRNLVLVLAFFGGAIADLAWSLVTANPQLAASQRANAGTAAWIGAVGLAAALWALFVANVLRQNRPELARLVPGHVGRLRAALLDAWAVLILVAAAVPGLAFDAPLAWACGTAAVLALLACAQRWPLVLCLVLAAVAGLVVASGTPARWSGDDALWTTTQAAWRRADALITAVVLAAGVAVLMRMVRSGGAGHAAQWARRRTRCEASQGSFGILAAWSVAPGGWRICLGVATRPYAWWMRRLLARRDSPVTARLLLGMGPATHWTTLLFQFVLALAVASLCAVVATFNGTEVRAGIASCGAFCALVGFGTPAVQALPRVRETRREQALLALLPGVGRGPAFSRWFAWQMSWPFLLTASCTLAVSLGLDALAEAILPGMSHRFLGGLATILAVSLLPMVAWQWRDWARMRTLSIASMATPILSQFLLSLLALWLHASSGVGYLPIGIAFAATAFAYCAWRWWRMGGEPTALPIGRLAR